MSFCVRLTAEAAALDIGGKARSLLRLADAGLPVPAAFVVTGDLFAALRAGGPPLPSSLAAPGALADVEAAARALRQGAWPAGFQDALAREVRALGDEGATRFAVRSSAAIEDDVAALGAGLFLSRVDLPAEEVEEALRAVLASAVAPGPIAYLARAGRAAQALGFAVLIHPFVRGDADGTAALDPAHGQPVIDARSGDAGLVGDALAAALNRLAARYGAVEVEWTSTGPAITFLQLRPFRAGAAPRPTPTARGADWRWDAAHNPLPLSPAQAGLVALVDARCRIGLAQQVDGGYLFYAPRADRLPAAAPASATEALASLHAIADARLTGSSARPLDEALELFVSIYQPLFGVVQPAARTARAALADFLRAHGFDPAAEVPALLAGVPSAAQTRAQLAGAVARTSDPAARATALAAYLDQFGDEAPAWDVAVPTWREAPAALEQRLRGPRWTANRTDGDAAAKAAARIAAALPEAARDDWTRVLAAARAGAAAAEDDDVLYARAQTHVRRALLEVGRALAAGGELAQADDVFWLPLERVRRHARGEARLSRAEAAALVGEARRADARARTTPPSLSLAAAGAGIVRGRSGSGGICVGRARIWTGADAPLEPSGPAAEPEIIVARTILPTELPLIAAAALVVETGGPLDHVAAQARERGIPAVVGAAGACAAFAEGDRVLVDGDAGLAARIA